MSDIEIVSASKRYDDGTLAVDDVSLTAPDGSMLVLVGPSGCGKTTLLRMIAGLETITSGSILIAGERINDVRSKDRDVAMIFQNYALYPHLDAYENIAFSLKLRHVPKQEIRQRIEAVAAKLELTELLKKKPGKLSGGQRQRIAMARAIVREPKAFLMDEPLSNLDAKLRVQLRGEIARLHRELGITTVYVTHDQTEAMTLGDNVAVMRLGRVQQLGGPEDIYREPANLFVAGFVGTPPMNFTEATVHGGPQGIELVFGPHRLAVPAERVAGYPELARRVGQTIILGFRPADMQDEAFVHDPTLVSTIEAPVAVREALGSECYLHLDVPVPPVLSDAVRELAADTDDTAVRALEGQAAAHQTSFIARVDGRSLIREGENARIAIDITRLHLFDPASGENLAHPATASGQQVVAQAPARPDAVAADGG
jgi:multiple sugar transport system ATP-binding protein